MRKTILGLALATLGYFAGTAGAAPERMPENGSRIINISTHGGTVTQRLELGLNKAAIVQLDTDARDVLVSSPEVVDAVVRTPRRIFLLALKTGQTNAFFFDGAGHQLASIDIRVEKDVTDLSAMMRLEPARFEYQGVGDQRQCRAQRHGLQRPGIGASPGSGGTLCRRSEQSRQHAQGAWQRAGDDPRAHRRNAAQHRQAVRHRPDGRSHRRRCSADDVHGQSVQPARPRAQRSVRCAGRFCL